MDETRPNFGIHVPIYSDQRNVFFAETWSIYRVRPSTCYMLNTQDTWKLDENYSEY